MRRWRYGARQGLTNVSMLTCVHGLLLRLCIVLCGLNQGQDVCLWGLLLQAVKRAVCCSAVLSQGVAVLVTYCVYVEASSVSVLCRKELS